MHTPLSREGKARLSNGIRAQTPVTGLTHNLYRYPARFSPEFVRAAVTEFTEPGDLVFDPFVGGGTTLVEASALGRDALGTDISSLAAFISECKTTVFANKKLASVGSWLRTTAPLLSVTTEVPELAEWIRTGYQKNINDQHTWRIRKLIEIGLSRLKQLASHNEQKLARCVLLKTGQWALDCRSQIPSTSDFQEQFLSNGTEIIAAAHEYASVMAGHAKLPQVTCVHRSAIGLESDSKITSKGSPKLVLTSPPYPGLHVLYHRWQVQGRRETAAPFWIAGTLDGDGASFYTFGDRKNAGLEKYFANVEAAFTSVREICNRETMVVQMVAFSQPDWQLPRYLESMAKAGFDEVSLALASEDQDGRIWRQVPGRKWYARHLGQTGGSREVVLFHRKH